MASQQDFRQWVSRQTDPTVIEEAIGKIDASPHSEERRKLLVRHTPIFPDRLWTLLEKHPELLNELSANPNANRKQARKGLDQLMELLEVQFRPGRLWQTDPAASPLSLFDFKARLKRINIGLRGYRAQPAYGLIEEDVSRFASWIQAHLRAAARVQQEAPEVMAQQSRLQALLDLGLEWLLPQHSAPDPVVPEAGQLTDLLDALLDSPYSLNHYVYHLILPDQAPRAVLEHALKLYQADGGEAAQTLEDCFYHLSAHERIYKHPDLVRALQQVGLPSIHKNLLNRLEDPAWLEEVLRELADMADSVAAEWVRNASRRRLARIPVGGFSRLLRSPRPRVRETVLRRLKNIDMGAVPEPPEPNSRSR